MASDTANARPADRGLTARLARIGRALARMALLIASLLAFPSVIPWMIAVWLAWSTWLTMRDRPGWLPLVVCTVILVVKRPAWLPGLVAMGAGMVVVSLADGFVMLRKPTSRPKRLAWGGVFVLWAAWTVMLVDWQAAARCGRPVELDPTRPVVCLGNSLTAWVPGGGYPARLNQMIALPVLNLGRPGTTSGDALELLSTVRKASPQVVIMELGGNDFVRGDSRAAVKANLEQIIAACRDVGAEVVLVEIPRGLVWDPFGGLERRLARQYDLELVADTPIRKLVLWSPFGPLGMLFGPQRYLSDDGLHPNARGDRVLADYVAEALTRLYGPAIGRRVGDARQVNVL